MPFSLSDICFMDIQKFLLKLRNGALWSKKALVTENYSLTMTSHTYVCFGFAVFTLAQIKPVSLSTEYRFKESLLNY